MATYGVMYTLLPNGFDAEGRARLSLVASPRPIPGQLGNNPVMRWPELAIARGTRFLVLTAGGDPVEATVAGPRPDQALWSALFRATTPVREPADALSGVLRGAASQSYVEELAAITALYQQADGAHALARGLHSSAVDEPDIAAFLDPKKITRDRVRSAAALLAARGHEAAARMAPLIPRMRRLALTAAVGDNPPPAQPAPAPLDVIAPIETADFAQVIGAVMRHPALALLLGLRVDLTMPAFTGQRMIRLGDLDGNPLDGPIPLAQPWSAVVCDPQARRFVMATQDDDRAEIVNGMLDLRPETGETARYVVSDVDVIGVGQQLGILATRQSGGLPVRRMAGLTVAQADRRARRFQHMLDRNARFEGPLAPPGELEGAPILYADDVTTGYRVDVSKDGGEFRSLMRRVANYTVGEGTGKTSRSVRDEAQIDSIVLTQQHDNTGVPHVFVGEELFDWHGWGFGGQPPGPVVGAETDGEAHVVKVDPEPLPGYPLLVKTEVEPGTLTRLRFGGEYRFRARAVDLAGNSIDPAACDPALVTAATMYHRWEPVPSPVIVPPKPYRRGESPDRMVVYSDGDGNPLEPPSERHVAPPKMSQRMAELHGAFDEAFGPGASQAARDRMFELSKKEEGSFLDPAPGIAVITTDPANPTPTTLPVPRGEPLAPGEYVIHDTLTPQTPYLPDVATWGLSLAGLPGGVAGPQTVPWNPAGAAWPDRPPARLVLRAGAAPGHTSEVQNGRSVVTVDLPPAAEATLEISSGVSAAALRLMGGPPPGTAEFKMALHGQNPLFSPQQAIELVHAVRKPTVAPSMHGLTIGVSHPSGTTDIDASATIGAHAPSTGRVALEATWTDIVDRGYGPVEFEERRVTVASAIFDRGDGSKQLAGNFDFGDAKRRVITYRPVAVTRFQEYFDVAEEDQRLLVREGAGEVRNVIGRIRPKPPKVHSIVPIVERQTWTGTSSGGEKFVEVFHHRKGVRVYLKRPWHDSGEGQLLGVLLPKDHTAGTAIAGSDSLRDKVTRWGTDLYDTTLGTTEVLTPDYLPGTAQVPAGLPVVTVPGVGGSSHLFAIAPFEVRYDTEKELWFADVLISGASKLFNHDMPFLRLALVAYQPTSVGQAGGNPGDLRCSAITIADPVQLTVTRLVKVSGVDTVPSVRVMVSNYRANDDAIFRARWQTRVVDPAVSPHPAPDICADSPWVSQAVMAQTGSPVSAVMLPLATANEDARDALRNGRIVVEEIRQGWSLHTSGQLEPRPTFTEVIEVKDLF